jgi:hypothetical protein
MVWRTIKSGTAGFSIAFVSWSVHATAVVASFTRLT